MLSFRTVLVSCLLAFIFYRALTTAQEITTRIISGTPTTTNYIPYIVQLRDTKGRQFCGGSLVTPLHVITAAHCFNSRHPRNTLVVGGASTVTEKGLGRIIRRMFQHPEYSPTTAHSDIAIIELDQPMTGPNIKTIKLCQQPLVAGQNLQVSGWGRTNEAINQGSFQLRTADVPVRRWEVCVNEFRNQVEKNMFCAGGTEAKGTCIGDSGGPAVFQDQLCGIVAIGYKCGTVGRPGGFADIFQLRPYIASILGF